MVSNDQMALKISHIAHPVPHACFIDLQMYQPHWILETKSAAPAELEFSIDKNFASREEEM